MSDDDLNKYLDPLAGREIRGKPVEDEYEGRKTHRVREVLPF